MRMASLDGAMRRPENAEGVRRFAPKRWWTTLLAGLALAIGLGAPASAVEEAAARQLVEQTVVEILNLANGSGSDSDKRVQFQELLDRRSDLKRISRLIAGRKWRVMSDQQKVDFHEAIIPYIANRFVRSFNDFRGGRLEVKGARPIKQGGEERVLVQSVGTRRSSQQGTDIVWLVTDFNGRPALLDAKVENLSLVISQRNEIASVLASVKGDVDKLIQQLRAAVDRAR